MMKGCLAPRPGVFWDCRPGRLSGFLRAAGRSCATGWHWRKNERQADMITLKHFRRLVDSYGDDLQLWPESAREDAQHILTHSAEAQAWLDGARHWDQVIAAAGASEDRTFWPAGEQDAALARLRLRVEARSTQRAAPA